VVGLVSSFLYFRVGGGAEVNNRKRPKKMWARSLKSNGQKASKKDSGHQLRKIAGQTKRACYLKKKQTLEAASEKKETLRKDGRSYGNRRIFGKGKEV